MNKLQYIAWDEDIIRVYQDLSWAHFDLDGNLIAENVKSFCMPGLTDEEKTEAIERIKSFKKAPYGVTGYIRFGNLPKSGKSKNYATGKLEKGVSCYNALWDLEKNAYVRTGNSLEGAAINYIIKGAPIYFITGEEVGTGSDGEPLLSNAQILAELIFDPDKKGYVLK